MKSKENPKSRNQDSPLCKLKPPPDPCARALPPESYPLYTPYKNLASPFPPPEALTLTLKEKWQNNTNPFLQTI